MVSQSDPLDAGAGLAVVGLYEDGALPDAIAGLAGAGDAKGAFKKKLLLHAAGTRILVVGLGKREEADAERLRVAAALAAKEAGRAGGELDRLGAAGVRRRRRRGGGAGHRHDPRLLPLRSLQGQGDGRRRAVARNRGADAAGAGGRRRGGRDGACLRRGAEPRPRPAEHSRQLRHAELPRGPRRGDRRRPRRGHGRRARPRADRRQGHGRPGRGQPRRRRALAADRPPLLRRRLRPDPGPGRQGSHLRHRRYLAQARRRDAGDEVRHVRSGRGARGGRRDRRARPRHRPRRRRALDREHALRHGDQARRRDHPIQRQDGRGQQHRRRGPADPRRRARLRGRARRRAARRPRHPDRRRRDRPRLHLRGGDRQRRRARRRRSPAPARRAAS